MATKVSRMVVLCTSNMKNLMLIPIFARLTNLFIDVALIFGGTRIKTGDT